MKNIILPALVGVYFVVFKVVPRLLYDYDMDFFDLLINWGIVLATAGLVVALIVFGVFPSRKKAAEALPPDATTEMRIEQGDEEFVALNKGWFYVLEDELVLISYRAVYDASIGTYRLGNAGYLFAVYAALLIGLVTAFSVITHIYLVVLIGGPVIAGYFVYLWLKFRKEVPMRRFPKTAVRGVVVDYDVRISWLSEDEGLLQKDIFDLNDGFERGKLLELLEARGYTTAY